MPKASDLVAELGRLVRFGIVGILVTLVYAGATFIGCEVGGLAAIHASILGQVASMGLSYFGHSMFSFGLKTDHRTYLWRFVVIAVLTFSMNGTVTWFLINGMGIHYGISIAVVGVLVPLTNYMCNRFWVFLPGLNSLQSAGDRVAPRCHTDR